MNLHHLEIFLAVCHAGSLQGAADKLGISRQAVSKAINALESSLGTALFIREVRGITLTTTAYVFKEHAQKVAIELAAIRKLRNIELLPRRPLMIYALDHVFSYIGSDFMV
ncbi:LysR family transcriptional regulator [Anaerobiospirillum succiniciproducens]|nr:LysR family transcriptional regulator [Anaerobiospirillum succiniciproducens]MCI6862824.1 LysR family transcriptional regulator [Anaerobiospirillum succiniciproducens]